MDVRLYNPRLYHAIFNWALKIQRKCQGMLKPPVSSSNIVSNTKEFFVPQIPRQNRSLWLQDMSDSMRYRTTIFNIFGFTWVVNV